MHESKQCAFALSEGNRILGWNETAAAALGWDADEVIGRDAADIIEAKDLFGNRWCGRHCGLREMSRRGENIETVWFLLKKKNGDYDHYFGSVRGMPSDGERGSSQGDPDEIDLLFEFQHERRRQTAGALIERLLYRQFGYVAPAGAAPSHQALRLTARQKEVLGFLADGLDPAAIAKQLGVSVNTVRNHIQRILFNLNCHSQVNAVAIAIRQGLI